MKKLSLALSEVPWKIPKGLTKKITQTRLVDMLTSMNQINNTNAYYIRNFHEQKIVVDSSASAILCGYPKEVAEAEGFNFYKRICDPDGKEWLWMRELFMKTHELFYRYPVSKRRYMISHYDFEAKTLNEGNVILHHKAAPYQLCDNGNLWMSLCSVTKSDKKIYGDATVSNSETGEIFVFVNDQYILSDKLAITQEDLMLLKLMCNDLSMDEIIAQLKIPKSSFHAKKQRLFAKLNVKTATGAIHKAHLVKLV